MECRPKHGGKSGFRSSVSELDVPERGTQVATREIITSSPVSRMVEVKPATPNYSRPLAVVTTLFFMWGFLTCLNDILVPHLKSIFDLNYAQVMLIQFA